MAQTVTVIDRRLNPADRHTSNRQRYIERKKAEVRKAVNKSIATGSIQGKYDAVVVDIENTQEPSFYFDMSGDNHTIATGNEWFKKGDKFRKAPPSGSGGTGSGSGAGNGGGEGGEDDFSFTLTREEFMEMFFEDLELPDLMRKAKADVEVLSRIRAGYKPTGNPADLDVRKTAQNALARRIALGRPSFMEIEDAELELAELKLTNDPDNAVRIAELMLFLDRAAQRALVVPWIDNIDTKYRQRVEITQPRENVVLFCVMDVSGSMGEKEKDIAKRYFMLNLELLNRTYGDKKVTVVFVRHTDTASECDEQEFFYGRETGGTVVSSALELVKKIIHDRFSPEAWNVYISQVSDGDIWSDEDKTACIKLLSEDLLPICQYYTYIDIPRSISGFGSSGLWPVFKSLEASHKNLAGRQIGHANQIWPVFREMFKKQA